MASPMQTEPAKISRMPQSMLSRACRMLQQWVIIMAKAARKQEVMRGSTLNDDSRIIATIISEDTMVLEPMLGTFSESNNCRSAW